MANLTEPSWTSGKREALADLISLVDAKDTPFTSMAKKESEPGATMFRWQMDSLPTPKTTGTVDGTDVTTYDNYVKDGSTIYRSEAANYIQVFRRSIRVSDLTQNIAVSAGVPNELANNTAKAIQAIKRDMEATLCSNNGAQADAGGSTPYLTRGLHKWLQPVASKDTTLPIIDQFCLPANSRSTVGTANLTETVVQDILTSMWNESGQIRDNDMLCGGTLKRAFTNLTFTTPSTGSTNNTSAIRTFNREADSQKYLSNVSIFEGDFGTIRLHPSQFLKFSGTAGSAFVGYIIPFDKVAVTYGGNVAQVTKLPNYGGGEARLIQAVAGLKVHNPLAFGVFDFTA